MEKRITACYKKLMEATEELNALWDLVPSGMWDNGFTGDCFEDAEHGINDAQNALVELTRIVRSYQRDEEQFQIASRLAWETGKEAMPNCQ